MVATLTATQLTKKVGRRPLLLLGHFLMGAIHLGVGLSNNANQDGLTLALILSFLFVYQNSSGPLAWVYAAETTAESAMGFVLLTLWGSVMVLTLVCPPLMAEGSLGPSPVFFIFSGLSFIATVFIYFYMKETLGLSDKEKRSLYAPQKPYNLVSDE